MHLSQVHANLNEPQGTRYRCLEAYPTLIPGHENAAVAIRQACFRRTCDHRPPLYQTRTMDFEPFSKGRKLQSWIAPVFYA